MRSVWFLLAPGSSGGFFWAPFKCTHTSRATEGLELCRGGLTSLCNAATCGLGAKLWLLLPLSYPLRQGWDGSREDGGDEVRKGCLVQELLFLRGTNTGTRGKGEANLEAEKMSSLALIEKTLCFSYKQAKSGVAEVAQCCRAASDNETLKCPRREQQVCVPESL